MKAHLPSTSSRPRPGPRLQLLLELSALVMTVAVLLAIVPIGKAWIQDIAQQNRADTQLSDLADEILVQALLCRRYEKDMLLNINDQAVRSSYLVRWGQASDDLERAIEGFAAVAVTEADRAQATRWRSESANYRAIVVQTIQAIDSGSITTLEDANTMLRPAKVAIRELTNTATVAAETKDTAIQLSSDALSSVISGNARLIVIFGLVGLLLCSALARR
jgi:hypothetical protein